MQDLRTFLLSLADLADKRELPAATELRTIAKLISGAIVYEVREKDEREKKTATPADFAFGLSVQAKTAEVTPRSSECAELMELAGEHLSIWAQDGTREGAWAIWGFIADTAAELLDGEEGRALGEKYGRELEAIERV